MSSDSLSASPSARVQTPSDLKWLLNERAALEGQAQLASERQSTLERQVARLSLELQEASSELTQTRNNASAIADRIGALDAIIRLGCCEGLHVVLRVFVRCHRMQPQ